MKTNLTSLTLLVLFFISCNKPNTGLDSEQVNWCFKGFIYNYERLLTPQDLNDLFNIDTLTMRIEHSNSSDFINFISYIWEHPQQLKPLKTLDTHIVTLKGLAIYDDQQLNNFNHRSAINYFDHQFKSLTLKEYNLLLANLDQKLLPDEATYQHEKNLLNKKLHSDYALIENLGDRAYAEWNPSLGFVLAVLQGNVSFTIICNTSNNADQCLRDAIQVAERILSKCDFS